MSNTRRNMFGLAIGASALAASPAFFRPALAQAKARVVVIGGGAGGATAARYLAKDGGPALDIVLVEPGETYTTCFHSNL